MAVDDVIVRAGAVAVPLDYTVPTGTEIIPRVISASFDGSSAGSDYVPLLEVIAPNGTVTARCCRQESIAAGASVAVSWFPGVDDETPASTPAGITSITSTLGTITVNSPTGPAANVDLPATGVLAGSYGDASDAVTITVDAEGRITAATSVPIAGGGAVVASDGWVPDTTETWTFASFTAGPPAVGTFTVPGDVRAKYTIGTRIKLTQTTTRYFVVCAAPTYDGINTTVSITGGTDYTLANAAISANYHSYVANPQGYPGWFTFAAAPTGFTGVPTQVTRFSMVGPTVTMSIWIQGTSNATTLTFTPPIASAQAVTDNVTYLAVSRDNSVNQLDPARWFFGSSSSITAQKDATGAAWTNAGNKATGFVDSYEVG